jgi:hypothetical protein
MTLFEEVIRALKNENASIRKNAILRLREIYRKHLISYAKQKYESEQEADFEIENSIKLIAYVIIEYGFITEEEQIVKNLKKIIALTQYEQQLHIEMQRYINHQTTEFLAIEKKIRKIITPYFQLLTQKYHPANTTVGLAGLLGSDWIGQQAFDTYIYKLIGKDEQFSRNKIAKFESLVYEMYMIFTLKYNNQETEQARVFNKIYELCRIRFAYLRHSDLDIFAESMEHFLSEIKQRDFILRSSLQNYWEGIYKVLLQKKFREQRQEQSPKTIKLHSSLFKKEEVFAFIQEGLDAIEHVHAGKARILLLTGRKTHFTQLLREATLAYEPASYGKMPDYKNKQSEAQQRQDCKKALVEWMKTEIANPKSNWFGERGLGMVKYISESKL